MSIPVSVLMTSFNREDFIEQAIKSVLNSTFKDFELIIVDDASSDKTYEIASAYALKDKRIRLYKNDFNLGQFKNRNKAASFARGEYLMHVDSDDQVYLNGIELCINAMYSYPEAGFGIYFETENSQIKCLQPEHAVRKHFFNKSFLTIGPGGTIIKKDLFDSIGGFPLEYSIAGDLYYNLSAAVSTKILLLPFQFLNYRIHEGQEINNKFDYLWANYTFLKDALQNLQLPLSESEKNWLMNKNRRRAIVNFFNYFRHTRDFDGIKILVHKTGFSINDLVKGIFH